jgi:hypothetical protein
LYGWQSGVKKVPKATMLAMYALVKEPLPEGFMDANI